MHRQSRDQILSLQQEQGPPSNSPSPTSAAKTFEELGLSPELLQGLYIEMKFERPSKIQAETLPLILTPPHRSLIAQAHNGSGKTTCFTLAMLSRVDPALHAPQALCVCPTRELVIQNAAVLERLGKYSGITMTSTAAADYATTRRARINEQIVVGTHGKLRDWMSKRVLSVAAMKVLVFDEADEMLKVRGTRRRVVTSNGVSRPFSRPTRTTVGPHPSGWGPLVWPLIPPAQAGSQQTALGTVPLW